MVTYLTRRILYAIPVLLGVNLITFLLFFAVNTPDDMARSHLGAKYVTTDNIQRWKLSHGYDKPLFFNSSEQGLKKWTDTLFYTKSLVLFSFDFGVSDSGRDITFDVTQRMWPSFALALPTLLCGLMVDITFALLMVFFRQTYLENVGVVLCVVMMSISGLFYIIAFHLLGV